jgi:hypothetical protein
LDNHLQLEVSGGRIDIRTRRDNVSEIRKDYFVRELVAEGFIPDDRSFDPVHWITDASVGRAMLQDRRANRYTHAVFVGMLSMGLCLAVTFLAFIQFGNNPSNLRSLNNAVLLAHHNLSNHAGWHRGYLVHHVSSIAPAFIRASSP